MLSPIVKSFKDKLLMREWIMTQDERRIEKWREVIDFMETNHSNPSNRRIEEYLMLNWIKYNRKLMNAGEMKE